MFLVDIMVQCWGKADDIDSQHLNVSFKTQALSSCIVTELAFEICRAHSKVIPGLCVRACVCEYMQKYVEIAYRPAEQGGLLATLYLDLWVMAIV
jgi:hypothetical protein